MVVITEIQTASCPSLICITSPIHSCNVWPGWRDFTSLPQLQFSVFAGVVRLAFIWSCGKGPADQGYFGNFETTAGNTLHAQ